jgi:hypothetical protein
MTGETFFLVIYAPSNLSSSDLTLYPWPTQVKPTAMDLNGSSRPLLRPG